MKQEDLYIKQLMQELPREKAPANITALIMQKIEKKTEFVFAKPLPLWKNSNLYLIVCVLFVELFLIWSVRDWFTFDNFLFIGKSIYSAVVRYFAMNNFSNVLLVLALVGVSVYFFVNERINYGRQKFIAAYL